MNDKPFIIRWWTTKRILFLAANPLEPDIRIRMSLVDTPERGQDGYQEAKDFVKDLCSQKESQVDIDDGQRRGDRYGRDIILFWIIITV